MPADASDASGRLGVGEGRNLERGRVGPHGVHVLGAGFMQRRRRFELAFLAHRAQIGADSPGCQQGSNAGQDQCQIVANPVCGPVRERLDFIERFDGCRMGLAGHRPSMMQRVLARAAVYRKTRRSESVGSCYLRTTFFAPLRVRRRIRTGVPSRSKLSRSRFSRKRQ